MHAKHVENLKTILDSIKHARFDRQVTTIGGGEYSPDEMLSVELAIESQLDREEAETKRTEG